MKQIVDGRIVFSLFVCFQGLLTYLVLLKQVHNLVIFGIHDYCWMNKEKLFATLAGGQL